MGGEHTPGPWDRDGLHIKTTRGVIAHCPVPKNGGVFDCQANARLIAAAPDLLAVAKQALKSMTICGIVQDGDMHQNDPVIPALRAAIAKATGTTSGRTPIPSCKE